MAKADQRTDTPPETPPPTLDERLIAIQERQLALAEAQLAQQRLANDVQAKQLLQTAKRSNASIPGISVFNPRGEKDFPMPRLKCAVYIPWKETPELHKFDREEVELINLLQPGEYQVELTDGSTVTARILGEINTITGHLESLRVEGADPGSGLFTSERKQSFPPLKALLRQMIGPPAAHVLTMKQEVALIASGDLAISQGC